MEPPWAREESRRNAQYHFALEVEELTLVEKSATGGLDSCRVAGRVTALYRVPGAWVSRRHGPAAPRLGEGFGVRVDCWPADPALAWAEPAGPYRVYYGGPNEPKWLEVWGSVMDGGFVVFEFTERNGAEVKAE